MNNIQNLLGNYPDYHLYFDGDNWIIRDMEADEILFKETTIEELNEIVLDHDAMFTF